MNDNRDYFGVHACGCITAWMAGCHSTKAEVRKFYRDMADTDREVRRAGGSEAKAMLARFGRCSHGPDAA